MKNVTVLLLLLTMVVSCDKIDNPDSAVPLPSELNGKWVLNSATCFCFFDTDFNFSGHKVEFKSDEGMLVVTNSGEASFIIDSGSYDVTVSGDRITINDDIAYTYEIKGETLRLAFVDNPDIADDEISLFYDKI